MRNIDRADLGLIAIGAVAVVVTLWAIVWPAMHPYQCVERAPVPQCGIETQCVEWYGEACKRFMDSCKLPGRCLREEKT